MKPFNGNKEYFDLMIEEIDWANSIITDFLSPGKGLHTELKAGKPEYHN